MSVNRNNLPKILYDQTQFTPVYLIDDNGFYISNEVYKKSEEISGYAPAPWYLYTQYEPEPFWFGAYSEEALERESEVGFNNFTDQVFVQRFEQDAKEVHTKTKQLTSIYFEKVHTNESRILKDDANAFVQFLYDIRDVLHFAMPRYLLTQPQRLYKLEKEVRAFSQNKEIDLLLRNGRTLTYASQIRRLVLDVAREIIDKDITFIKFLEQNKEWVQKIETMTEELGFLNHSLLGGEFADTAYVEKGVNRLVHNRTAFESERTQMDKTLDELEKRKEILLRNRSKREYQLADVGGLLPVLRFDMNTCILVCLGYLEQCVAALRDRLKLTDDQIHAFCFDELVAAVNSGVSVDPQLLAERQRGFLRLLTKDNACEYVGKHALDKISDLLEARKHEMKVTKEVKGTVASFPNKEQIVIKGEAIIFGSFDFTQEGAQKRTRVIEQFPEGNILIATQTHPDLVPAMKKAAAIVTDEGGITCHAAIVSRELGKPCIIGTRLATKIFKNGDQIEIDMKNATVRKL